MTISIVIPASDAGHLGRLLESLSHACLDGRPEIVVVDDRACQDEPMRLDSPLDVRLVTSAGRGRAVARNVGMRAASAEWVVVLDEDQTVGTPWYDELVADLARVGQTVAGVAARAGAASPEALRMGADVAYRRLVALSLGGFQGRFPRGTGYDDVELAQRMARAGWSIRSGTRSAAMAPAPAGRVPHTSTSASFAAEEFAVDGSG